METAEFVKKLRNRENVTLWDCHQKLRVRIQLNKNESFVCWERWVSYVGGKWVNWNKYLSLKDVLNIRSQLAIQASKKMWNKSIKHPVTT